jgi:hypothetical protein
MLEINHMNRIKEVYIKTDSSCSPSSLYALVPVYFIPFHFIYN